MTFFLLNGKHVPLKKGEGRKLEEMTPPVRKRDMFLAKRVENYFHVSRVQNPCDILWLTKTDPYD